MLQWLKRLVSAFKNLLGIGTPTTAKTEAAPKFVQLATPQLKMESGDPPEYRKNDSL